MRYIPIITWLSLLSSYFSRFFFYCSPVRFLFEDENLQEVEKYADTPAAQRPHKPGIPSTGSERPYQYLYYMHANVYGKVDKKPPLFLNPFLCLFIDLLFWYTSCYCGTSILRTINWVFPISTRDEVSSSLLSPIVYSWHLVVNPHLGAVQ